MERQRKEGTNKMNLFNIHLINIAPLNGDLPTLVSGILASLSLIDYHLYAHTL